VRAIVAVAQIIENGRADDPGPAPSEVIGAVTVVP
jgi:hypothetical protein